MHNYQFRAKSQGQALHTPRFALLTSSQFLRTLSHPPKTTDDGSMLALTQEDHETFKTLNNRRPDIKKVVTALGRKRVRRMLRWIRMVRVMRISRYLRLLFTYSLECSGSLSRAAENLDTTY